MPGTRKRLGLALTSVLAASLAVPAAAGAAAQWLEPVTLSDPAEENVRLQVAADGQNNSIVAWIRADCTGPPEMHTCSNPRVQTAVKAPGQPFGATR